MYNSLAIRMYFRWWTINIFYSIVIFILNFESWVWIPNFYFIFRILILDFLLLIVNFKLWIVKKSCSSLRFITVVPNHMHMYWVEVADYESELEISWVRACKFLISNIGLNFKFWFRISNFPFEIRTFNLNFCFWNSNFSFEFRFLIWYFEFRFEFRILFLYFEFWFQISNSDLKFFIIDFIF